MADDRVGVEAGPRVLFVKELLVAFDHRNVLAHQRIEARARDMGRPGAHVLHEQVHLVRLELELLEEVLGDLEEGKGVELAAHDNGGAGVRA
ncbi:hypothetical protein SDC9_173902 [bioreactor metagenome]|uniref:Uncharacterized protein n=1 Tax=bioreactor metagenome TaxID=1076179 RepID=A0A645GHQ0_9ZZZZ